MLVALTLLLAACSGVPSSSSPEVIRSIGGGVAPAQNNAPTPPPGADPQFIVSGFLLASLGVDAHHAAARQFLTQDQRNKWTDTTVTVLSQLTVGLPDDQDQVTVSGVELGTISSNGIYTPQLLGDGTARSGDVVTFPFTVQKVDGQWRISQLQQGILIDEAHFSTTYRPHPVYFFDQAQRTLVPDLRYSSLTDQPLCNWLLEQLGEPPRPELVAAAVTTNLPAQNTHAGVTCATASVQVNLPGSGQLDGPTRQRLAAQLAFTFSVNSYGSLVELHDSSRLVSIPDVPSQFEPSDFAAFTPSTTPPSLYYIRQGALIDGSTGSPVPGAVGSSAYALQSAALAQRNSEQLIAGVSAKDGSQRLVVGVTPTALRTSDIAASALGRPAWAPDQTEVWISTGSDVRRVPVVNGVPQASVPVSLKSLAGGASLAGSVRSIAFSPDGVRVALGVQQPGGYQVWIGSVVRGDAVRVDGLMPVTPAGISVADVSWNDVTTLYLVGTDTIAPGQAQFWSVQSDGSQLIARSTAGLPSSPELLAVAPNALPYVSTGGTIWVQRGSGSWGPPGNTTDQAVSGTAPTYLQ
ncbi:MAG: hypothetical protein JO147_08210 [Actinobacteria bacterium]|nr:hypothetical protein [Actinomycetota bacterium]